MATTKYILEACLNAWIYLFHCVENTYTWQYDLFIHVIIITISSHLYPFILRNQTLVREHRNELFKFMKEVRSRDPARRMTLRYDKLYIGNDIFFVNDRTRRVERLHQNVDAGTNFSSSLGNLLINDSQVSIRLAVHILCCLCIINYCGLYIM